MICVHNSDTIRPNWLEVRNINFEIQPKKGNGTLSLPINHFRITAIWPGDRIRRPEHPTENEVRCRSCDESV